MIVIHVAGNEKIGVGNLSRCKTLANELYRNGVNPIIMIYESTYEIAKEFLPMKGIDLIIVDSREKALIERKTVSDRFDDKTKVLVTDIYDLEENDERIARRQGYNLLIHMNDSGIPQYNPDYMIDQEAFIKPWLKSSSIKFIRGSKYNLIKPEVGKLRPDRAWNKDKVEKVLLCFGGSDPGKCTETFIRDISNNRELDNIKFNIVIGPGFTEKRWNLLNECNYKNITLRRSPKDLNKIMLETDVIITTGGITSYEGMCLGKPVLCVGWGNMKYYIEELDKMRLVKNLGDRDEAVRNLSLVVKSLEELKEIASNGFSQVDNNGAKRISEYIKELISDMGEEI